MSAGDDFRLETASATGGISFSSAEETELHRRCVQYLAQRIGSQLASGSISKMSMPVHLNEPRSFLMRLTDDWAYAPHYLPRAAVSNDPVERMKLVAAFVVSGLHCIPTLGKQFNPIIGETFSATLVKDTGAAGSAAGGNDEEEMAIFVEQTSHHPAVSHYIVEPSSEDYLLAGYIGIEGGVVWGIDTALKTRRVGVNMVQFADGSRIVFNYPRMLVKGLLGTAERKCEMTGAFSLYYEEHDLVFDFLVDPPQAFRWSPFAAPRQPSDYCKGVLYRLTDDVVADEDNVRFAGVFKEASNAFYGDPEKAQAAATEAGILPVELRDEKYVSLSVIEAHTDRARRLPGMEREVLGLATGTYLGYLDIEGERVWDVRETPKGKVEGIPLREALKSDCRVREDVVALEHALSFLDDPEKRDELIDEAQGVKEKLEVIQRMDRKFRAEGEKAEAEAQSNMTSECTTPTQGQFFSRLLGNI